jgi:hypothetical protein
LIDSIEDIPIPIATPMQLETLCKKILAMEDLPIDIAIPRPRTTQVMDIRHK